jgi:hypothetical protein
MERIGAGLAALGAGAFDFDQPCGPPPHDFPRGKPEEDTCESQRVQDLERACAVAAKREGGVGRQPPKPPSTQSVATIAAAITTSGTARRAKSAARDVRDAKRKAAAMADLPSRNGACGPDRSTLAEGAGPRM